MTIPGSRWNGGCRESLTEPTGCVLERLLDDGLPPEPPTDVWQDIRYTGKNKNEVPEPLKMIAFFGHQKLPKVREESVIVNTGSGLSVRT
jgi:hypothetical protein